jgi:hypothetical protein
MYNGYENRFMGWVRFHYFYWLKKYLYCKLRDETQVSHPSFKCRRLRSLLFRFPTGRTVIGLFLCYFVYIDACIFEFSNFVQGPVEFVRYFTKKRLYSVKLTLLLRMMMPSYWLQGT